MKNRPLSFQALLPAILFVIAVSLLGPWWNVYEMDNDEGVNLMKAALVARGYGLYSEIWSDQPPLLTHVLAVVIGIAGQSVPMARAVMLASACLLLWSLFRIVARKEGTAAAWVAVVVLGSGFLFLKLSVSVMIGLHALSLGVLALDLALSDPEKRSMIWASAAVFALALLTKMFVLVLVPTLILACLLAPGNRRRRGLEWAGVSLVVFILGAWIMDVDFMAQLVRPHVGRALSEAFPSLGGPARFWSALTEHPQYLCLAGAGLAVAWPRCGTNRWLPPVWVGTATAVLLFHHPLWYHHLLLVQIPLAWMAGWAGRFIWESRNALLQRQKRALAGGVVVAAALLVSAPSMVKQIGQGREMFLMVPVEADLKTVSLMRKNGAATHWVLTDRPMDAFRAGLVVPPPVAVYSIKRLATKNLTPEAIVDVLRTYEPEQISFRRFRISDPVLRHLKRRRYVPILKARDQILLVTPALAKK